MDICVFVRHILLTVDRNVYYCNILDLMALFEHGVVNLNLLEFSFHQFVRQ